MMITDGKLIGARGNIFITLKQTQGKLQLIQYNVQDFAIKDKTLTAKGKFLRNGRLFDSHGQAQAYVKKYLEQFGWVQVCRRGRRKERCGSYI